MSTNTRINVIATALVAIALVLGATFGSYVLGGTPTPTEAVVPAGDTTACVLCTDSVSTGGGGNAGSNPNPGSGSLMTTNGGSGGTVTGGSDGPTR